MHLDIYTFRQISKFTARDIETINDAIVYFSGRIERDEWVAQAKELVHDEKQRMEFLKRISERKNQYLLSIELELPEKKKRMT